MCPERMGEAEIRELELQLGPYKASGQLQQRPSPLEGGIFKREWWKFYRVSALPPTFDEVALSFDCAFKDLKESDFVAGLAGGRLGADIYILPVRVLDRLDILGTMEAIRMMSNEYPAAGAKYIEDKANGPAVIQMLRHEIPGLIGVNVDRNKVGRAQAVVPFVAAGNIHLPHPDDCPWVKDFIESCAVFPNGPKDDDVDAFDQLVNQMRETMVGQFFGEFRASGPRPSDGTANAQHVVEAPSLKPWFTRWISIHWSVERTVAHWYAEDADGRVVVYRELSADALSAEEAGAEVARKSAEELSDGRKMTAWVHPDHFEAGLGSKTIAQHIQLGIERELKEPVFLYAHTLDETMVGDVKQRMALLEKRQAVSGARILLQGAVIDDKSAAWEHARGLMRWWPTKQREKIAFDRNVALELKAGPDGERAYAEYMRMCSDIPRETLPKLLVSDCPALVAALTGLVRDERKNLPLIGEGQQAAESFYLGMVAHRAGQTQEPMDEFVAKRLNEVMRRKPDIGMDRVIMITEKAEHDWQARQPKTYHFRRAGLRHRRVG